MDQLAVPLLRIVLRGLEYEELPADEVPVPVAGEKLDADVDLAGSVRLFDGGMEVQADLTLSPDPVHAPYRIAVRVSGLFGRAGGLTDEQMAEFAKSAGFRILFPYLRELVSNVTGRTLFGPFFIDPLSITMVDA